MWSPLLSAAVVAPLVLALRLEEEDELPVSRTVSGLSANGPPVT